MRSVRFFQSQLELALSRRRGCLSQLVSPAVVVVSRQALADARRRLYLCGSFYYDTKVAVVVASVEAVVFNLRKQPKKAYRWAFNLAQNIVVVFLVGRVYEVIDARVSLLESGGIGTIFLLILAPWLCGFLYYTLSSGLTALA